MTLGFSEVQLKEKDSQLLQFGLTEGRTLSRHSELKLALGLASVGLASFFLCVFFNISRRPWFKMIIFCLE